MRDHRPKILFVPAGSGYKILTEWIWCLYDNVIDRLFVVTSQSTSERKVQTLRLDANQVALIRGPILAKLDDLNQNTERLEVNNVLVLELNVSPKFALMKQVVLNVNSAESTMSFSSTNIIQTLLKCT